jgi:cell division protein ZipA
MEADVLRWSLLVIGSLVIVSVAIHGIWLSRKNSEKKLTASKHKNEQQYQPSGWQTDSDDFNEEVHYESGGTDDDLDIKSDIGVDEIATDIVEATSSINELDELGLSAVRVVPDAEKVNADTEAPTSKIYASVVTQPKPEYATKYTSSKVESLSISQQQDTSNHSSVSPKDVSSDYSVSSHHSSKDNYQTPEPPPFLLKKEGPESEVDSDSSVLAEQPTNENPSGVSVQKEAENIPNTALVESISLTEKARNLVKIKKVASVKKHRDPKIAEDQMHIDFDEQPTAKPEPKEELKTKPVESEQPQVVLVLNIKSADDNPILGSALLPMLLTLGFKFGDQDIFHRHVNSNGKGPVLFSLANMFKPGNFDIDNLENFTTHGISLFMILPTEGEPHQVFNMMHNAARKIAEEFSTQIYDGKRTLLTNQSLQQYVEKIREFERQRLLRD